MNLTDNAREFAEGGDRYTGAEVRVWVYKLCDKINQLHDENAFAYAKGRKDEREYLLKRVSETMPVCGVSKADLNYVLTSIKDL